MKVIIGLGNPGSQYRETRHNLGFKVADKICEQYRLVLKPSSQAKGLFACGEVEAEDVMLFLPLTYMNNSGSAVRQILEKNTVSNHDFLVICDDFNLNLGRLRIRAKGSDGGHNGLSSIIQCLGTEEFARLRLGIGAPPGKKPASRFVLEDFTKKEKAEVVFLVNSAVDCCLEWLTAGMNKAMERFNKKPSDA